LGFQAKLGPKNTPPRLTKIDSPHGAGALVRPLQPKNLQSNECTVSGAVPDAQIARPNALPRGLMHRSSVQRERRYTGGVDRAEGSTRWEKWNINHWGFGIAAHFSKIRPSPLARAGYNEKRPG